jgi:hypothetical protein
MLLRRVVPATLAAAAFAACQPSVPKRTNPSFIDYVVFDPASSQIPLPNDLAREPSVIDAATGAQREFLQLNQDGFFNDQTVPVTIDVQRFTLGPGAPEKGPPPVPVDLATITPQTLLVLDTDPAGTTTRIDVSTGIEKKYSVAPSGDSGQLTLRPAPDDATGSRRWQAGHLYSVLLRGGESGVKLDGGGVLTAMPTMYLLTRGVDLSKPENQYLLPGSGRAGRAATGQQLEALRQKYLPLFKNFAEQDWGAGATQEIVSVQTFQIAPSAGTAITIDAVLPSDALLDPLTGKVSLSTATDAFCDWASLDALGSCALAEGLSTLDGFSTTAMWLIGSTGLFEASTVTGDSVLVYEVPASGPATLVPDLSGGASANYVTQPPALNSCPGSLADCAPVIGLQPAVTAGPLFLPPFKEATQYAVLVTNRVKDIAGDPLVRSNFTKLLFFQNPLADLATGKSNVSALTDAQAVGLEELRLLMPALLARASADKGVAPDEVVMAYSVKTQSITGTALELAAAPYADQAAFVPGTPVDVTAAYPAALPAATFHEILAVPIPTLDPIDVTTGAFNPDPTAWTPAALTAVVVVPDAALVTASCPAPNEALKCAPLVVFQHGITRNKTDVFALASTFASAGFVVAAIDSPLHGNRAYCTADAQCVCDEIGAAGFLGAPGTCAPTCGFFGPAGLQGDAVPIGQCTNGSVAVSTGGARGTGVSGAFLVTQNLFRTRDALRQDVLDNSALILAIAPPSPIANPFATRLASEGIAIDGARVYWIGQSLGGIEGVLNVAANPRLSRAVLNAAGAPVVDVITQSPAFASEVNALLASLPPPAGPITLPEDTRKYLQFIQVAKWILDPAEPANFAGHVTANPLANPLASAPAAQAAKNVFGQYAECDQTILNPFSLYLFGLTGLSSNTTPNGFTKYTIAGAGTPGACTEPSSNPAHGFLLNFTDAAKTVAGQTDAAAYLVDLTVPSTDR